MEQNLALTSSRLGAEIARDDVRTAFGGHLPTVDLVVGKSHIESADITDFRSDPARGSPAASRFQQPGQRHRQVHQPAGHGAHLVERRHALAREAVVDTAGRPPSSASSACRAKPSAPRATPISASCRKSRACRRSSRRWNRSAPRCKATEAGYDVGTRTAVDVLAARQHAGPGLHERTRAAATTTCSTCCASSRPRASSIARRSKT